MDKLFCFFNISLFLCMLPACSPGDTVTLSMEEALRRAENHSVELQAGEAALRAARSALFLGLKSFLPSISFSYSGNRAVARGGPDSEEHRVSLHVEQLLFNGGERIRQRQMNRKQLQLQKSELAANRESLKDQVWNVYQEIAMLRERYKLQKTSLQLAEELMRIVEMKFDQGSITELDYIQGLITLQESEHRLEETGMDLHGKEFFLLFLLGLPQHTRFELTGETFVEYSGMIIPFDRDQLYRLALENNHEVLRSAFTLLQQKAALGRLGSLPLPALSLEGGIEFSGPSFPLSSPEYSLSLAVHMPRTASPSSLSAGIRNVTQSTRGLAASFSISPLENPAVFLKPGQRKTQLTSLNAQHQQLIEDLRNRIGQAMDRYALLIRQLALFRKTVSLRRREYELLTLQWRLGEALQTQVLEAHAGLASREIELLKNVLEVKLAERDLERLAGLPPGTFTRMERGRNR